jgi:hypothetical protein
MRYENKFWNREGSVFQNRHEKYDLSRVRFLHSGVDTVKQLFKCLLKSDVLEEISKFYESGFDKPIEIEGREFLISKSSKKAGYQWILRNLDEGYTVLIKSFYAQDDLHASHIKIEVSPRTISLFTPAALSAELIKLAKLFGTQIEEHAIAAHIAVDLKGFELPDDFEYKLATKAKRQMRHLGISDMTLGINETTVVHGDRQTFTFGSASSLQFQLYDKVTEAIKTDKISFWEKKWSQTPSVEDCFKSEYEPGDSVKRLEMRFHHSVIQEFCNGTKDEAGEYIRIKNFEDLAKHLTALWRYALNNFRLQHSTSYIHPVWQLLIEDVRIFAPSPDLMYVRKPKPAGESTRRNVAFWLGNSLKLMCRRGFKVEIAVNHILSAGLDAELLDYFGLFGHGARDFLRITLFEFVEEKFKKLTLLGVAA